jgi:hypothetical protein
MSSEGIVYNAKIAANVFPSFVQAVAIEAPQTSYSFRRI